MPQPNLLDEELELITIPYPSMKLAVGLGIVLFLFSFLFHLFIKNFAIYWVQEGVFSLYLLEMILPLMLLSLYLFIKQKERAMPCYGVSFHIPQGNNLWMLLLITPALYMQIVSLRYFLGDISFSYYGTWHMIHARVVFFLVFVIFIPVMQEFVFRAVILKALLQTTDAYKAVGISALIAAAPYIYPLSILLYLPISCFLGWLYYRSRSLVFTFIANALISLVPFLINIKNPEYPLTPAGMIKPVGLGTWLLVSVIVFWVGVLFFNKNIIESNKTIN